MSKPNEFRSENIDYKDLVKKREENKKKVLKNKNPFILSVPQTNQELYQTLYKFNAETVLNQYQWPSGQNPAQVGAHPEDPMAGGSSQMPKSGEKNKSPKSKMGGSQMGSASQGAPAEGGEEFFEKEESKIEGQEVPEYEAEVFFQEIVKSLFNVESKKPPNKIQNALFVNAEVQKTQRSILTGEHAISFFAKYGNTTPIKFITCVRAEQDPSHNFRPYDLKVIFKSENQKELTLDEYYTISAHGIVHVFTDKGKKKKGQGNDTSTEVITLSDWMHESTMFNIITNIQFFKNYAITKIYNIWKANVHYRIFCKTRKKLIQDAFIAKPAFASHLLEMNKLQFDIQNIKTISQNITQNKSWELEDFKQDQRRARNDAFQQYEQIIEKLVGQVENVCREVVERTKIKDQSDLEEARFGQQVKQKPMNEIRKEAEERQYLLDRALKDKEKLRNFTRLIDYISVETLYATTLASMKILLLEMRKDSRKNGLFNTYVMFSQQSITHTPDESEIIQQLNTLLEEVINSVKNQNRIILRLENHVKVQNTDQLIDVKYIIMESVKYKAIQEEVVEKVKKDFKVAHEYVNENYEKCREIYNQQNGEWNIEQFMQEEQKVDIVKQKISDLKKYGEMINKFIKDVPKGILQVNSIKIKNLLGPYVDNSKARIKEYLYNLMKKKSDALNKQLQTYNGNLSKPPNTLKEYCEYIEFFNEITEAMNGNKLENKKKDIEEMQFELKKEEQALRPMDTVQLTLDQIQQEYLDLTNQMKVAEVEIKDKKTQMQQNLENEIEDLKRKINNTITQVNYGKLIQEETPPAEALEKLQEVKTKNIDNYLKKDKTYMQYKKLIDNDNPQPIKDLQELQAKFNDRKLLWTHVDQFQTNFDLWQHSNILNLNSEDIEKEMKKYESTCIQLKQRILNLNKEGKDPVLDQHTRKVQEASQMLPVIQALCNRDLRPRHWKRILEILGQPYQPGATNYTLQDLISFGVKDKMDQMEEISGRASGEASIEMQVEEIRKKWLELNFIVRNYREQKDKFVLGTVEDIIAALDDHQLKVQTMLGTRFVAEIRDTVEEWQKKLMLINDIIDEWLYCQRQWMYLENIFGAEDIQKQLPQETAKFQTVDKFWREIMLKTNKRPLVQDCCNSEELLKKFQMQNKALEDIQKCLENYLETKRAAFPRFYFLSNDELLEILSQTRNPHAVQGHLRKCFDNINRIQFTEEEESKEIVAMISAEPEIMPEKVKYSASVFAEGNVEHWLFRVQEMMIKSLYDNTKAAFYKYPENGLDRRDWLFSFPAQPVLTIDLVKWTQGCTDALVRAQAGQQKAVDEYREFMMELITKMVSIVRGQLNTLERTLMGALIVLDVHARDVVVSIARQKVNNLNDFEWSKQLRYYWEKVTNVSQGPGGGSVDKDGSIEDCVVKQTNTYFRYGYEYLGNGPRLVITPLTDKCYMTLTGAKHLNYGGAPAGPAGTGKTETTKDLAKALAIQCVVFNCSDGLDFKTMGRFFSGLSQCGAWSCFDEFNRIDIEVLSVIAQQILTIQQAIRGKCDLFEFEGRTIPLNTRFGVFITMNPGYAGRTELPDNLKALFRPVAMMIPDYGLIAEIILFSEGFETANALARKMVNLYKLSSEQLSKQDHYDFGMRAVKSVLVMAGALRRKDPEVSEDIVLIRAMRDSNVPKFLEQDLPLFRSIITDLFPGVNVPFIDYGALQKAIEHQLEVQHYLKPAAFLTKIIQLMETIMVRHGVMIVGTTGTGKTTNYRTLSSAMGQLNKEGSTDYYHKQVKIELLNPKSVTMNELFGYTNLMTNEWTDGIVAKIVRDNVQDTTDMKKWVVFDGPVDALWIENMNTVLDDNKMLCLNNGQRIKLPQTFTMMFEVNDLAVASPATVSRCGMVYMEPVHLGWEPLIDTWSFYFKERFTNSMQGGGSNEKGGSGQSQQQQQGGAGAQSGAGDKPVPPFVNNLVEKIRVFFKENLPFIRRECREIIASVDSNLVRGCLNLVDIFFNEAQQIHNNFQGMSPQECENLCAMVFIFAFIWSAGANLFDNPANPKDSSRSRFSSVAKSKFLKILTTFPYDGDVYDHYLNFEKKEFKPWTELVTDFKYVKDMPYFNILVPTADTVKYKYMIKYLIGGGFNVLLSGETGVGKSVIIQDFITSIDVEKYVFTTLNFSAQTSSKNLQDLFMDKDKFQRKRKDMIGPPAGKRMVVFIDDVNMPQLEKFGAQPPNELFRQIIDHGGFYDLKKLFFVKVQSTNFITACATPGGGRNQVTPRLFRHFNMMWMPDLSQKSMETIFIAILKGFLQIDPATKSLEKFAPPLVKTTVEIYSKITKELLPTPKKSHYTFNLRDISKIFQGILMVTSDNLKDKEMLLSLWVHECSRVFHDRLIDSNDRDWFYKLIGEPVNKTFEFEWDAVALSQFIFGDYANTNKEYLRIENIDQLPTKLGESLLYYNSLNPKQMNLVFFKDAIMHLSRISRVLRQPRGNALLIGVGGSGRQSLTRMATFLRDYQCFSIEISKNYKDPQWKDDLKKLLKNAGAKNTPQVFLFSDSQIVKESFLEDINNVLNTGEIPNLWAPEDFEEIINDVRPIAKEQKLYDSRDVLLKFFVSLVRDNLHIVLAFSPVGEKLRNRCRQFPSIINCCAIDWFDKWPQDALNSVAQREYSAQERLGLTEYVEKLSQMSVKVHADVQDKSEQYYDELRRRNYVTPTSYLELMKVYIDQMKTQQSILPIKINKYTVGLQTLKETNEEVSKLQQKIIEFKPILEESSRKNAELLVELTGKKKIAGEQQAVCQKETAEAQVTRDEVNEMRASCQKDLDEAIPILEAAEIAVKSINKDAINEMKSFKQPPALVLTVMSACCLLFGEKEEWDSAKKLLGDIKFLERLLEYRKTIDQVPEKRFLKLRQVYVTDPNFNKEKVHSVSQAAEAIVVWILATDKFQQIKKVVGPKEKKLREAESKLREVEAELAKKEAALKEVQDMVADLERNLEKSTREKEMLQAKKEQAEIQLRRAEKLLNGLSGEAERWKITQGKLNHDLKNLFGNILLAAASISYLGPFNYQYRQDMLKQWIQDCKGLQIPVSDDFSLMRILTEEVQIREWQEHGLPADPLSLDNGIFIFNSRRWPLIIDPQGQANKWIKHLWADSNLQTTKLTESNFLKTLENSIRFGQPVLLENIEEELDPALEPVLLKQTTKKGAMLLLRLGDQDIPYNSEFRFYMTTKMPNPHYIPEICIKTTIINFTVTPQGLEDQLLIEVVRYEKIELEEKRIQLILEISQCKRQLQELEDRILKQIAEAQGHILDDEELINTLDASKDTSEAVNQRMAQSKVTAEEIDRTRELYRPVAKRGSVLYFVIASLANIDPMYQYSLEFFIKLFKLRLEKAPNPPELEERLRSLVEDITQSFYINICRGLFEKDKLLFSYLIAANIKLEAKEINIREWNFFTRGPTGEIQIPENDVIPSFINEKTYKNCLALSQQSSTYRSLINSLKDESEKEAWSQLIEAKDPTKVELPASLQNKFDAFQNMLFLKLFREEKLIMLIKQYVFTTLGEMFTVSPLFDLKGAFTDSTCTTPIIFVLSPGADPISYLLSLAKEKEFDSRLKMLSLGQGQGEIARELIKAGRRNGDWVCLQNCHLAISWMTDLERIQEMQVEADTHPDYRLWLTSMPTNKFPVPVLQSGIKLTNEPPKGLKANINRTYAEVNEKIYESCTKSFEYKKLLYSLAFFHAVILERRKFGAIGWNISYEWMNSDFETCQLQLMMYLNEQPEVPWTTLKYLIAEINYGGRVTDDKDVRLITALLNKYFCPQVLKESYNFSSSGVYHSPVELELEEVKKYIRSFPPEDDPEVFGLHANSNITFEQKMTREFLETLISVQPRSSSAKGGESPDDIVKKMAEKLLQEVPETLPEKREADPTSLEVFRFQEVQQFNRLIVTIKKTLQELIKAINGTVVMSLALENMFNSFLLKKVPENWEKVGYPSLKPLSSWFADLIERVKFFREWVTTGSMKSYWVSAMFFPQGFMTAALQTYARKTLIAIDTLMFRTEAKPFFSNDLKEVPENGVNVHGLYLEGCRWDIDRMTLNESLPKILYPEMPVIWLDPVIIENYKPDNVYKCPLYKTSTRKGTLSTTGHSTNFVMYMDLKSGVEPDHWVRSGVALLCMLDD